jgi:hypothetical protein
VTFTDNCLLVDLMMISELHGFMQGQNKRIITVLRKVNWKRTGKKAHFKVLAFTLRNLEKNIKNLGQYMHANHYTQYSQQ